MRRLPLAGLAALLLPGALWGQRGTLLIVGGGAQPPELVRRFVDLAGGSGTARIAVLPMASSEPLETGKEKAEELEELGARVVVLNLTRQQAESDSAVRLLDGVTGIWFTGGDQVRITAALLGTRVLGAIRRRYQSGAVIGGTSAGAAIMSDSMITGNQFRAAPDTNGYYGDEFASIARHFIEIVPGLGFLPGTIVDQHFIVRERHNRLISVVLERPAMIGVGIDEGTALEVEPDGSWQVLGASAAVIYDARGSRITDGSQPLLGGTGIQLHVLPSGSRYDPRNGRVSLPN
jgi:cyanophycinase